MKQRRVVTVVLALAITAMVAMMLNAQGPQGRGRGGGAAGGAAKVEHVVVHGKALEGNLEGDSPDREVTIYLPPSYQGDQMRRYPVVYLLHGFGSRDDAFTGKLVDLAPSADRLGSAGGFSAPIIVIPNASTLHGSSMYSNSVTTGNWETFIAEDLVSYIDGHYRTIAARISRGLAGYAMGGYGALRIGMKRPDVFSSLYVMSAESLEPNDNARPDTAAAAEAIKTRAQAEQAARAEEGRTAGFGPSLMLAMAAAWSPNAGNAPLFLDLPFKDGKPRADIAARWSTNAGLPMAEANAPNLKKLYAIVIEVGTKDPLLASNRQLHQALMRLQVPHYFEEYEGDHTNRLLERIDRNLLPFFSKSLAAPANPTSPAVQ